MRKNFIIALLLSLLLIHLPLVVFIRSFGELGLFKRESVSKPDAVFVTLPQPREIVDLPKPKRSQKPDQARVQSAHDVSAKKETVAATSKPSQSRSVKKAESSASKAPSPKAPKKHPEPRLESRPVSLADALLVIQKEKDEKELKELKRFEKPEKMDLTSLQTSFSSGGDFLPDYKVGSRTYVNALGNPHIQYFIELKRKFRMTWNPGSVLQHEPDLRKKGEVTTVFGVSVNNDGKISRLILLKSSGSSGFDAEAKRTIRDSSPFSRPPVFLLKEEKELHMAWTFVVYF